MGPLKALNDTKLVLDEHAVMLLVGGQGGLKGFSPPGIWGLQLTLIKSEGEQIIPTKLLLAHQELKT